MWVVQWTKIKMERAEERLEDRDRESEEREGERGGIGREREREGSFASLQFSLFRL